MDYKVTVNVPANRGEWDVTCHRWLGPNDAFPVNIPLNLEQQGDGSWTCTVMLQPGIHSLVCEVRDDFTLTAALDPEPRIFQPQGYTWPVSCSMPPHETAGSEFVYFRVVR